ncbi:MAG: glycosyltransferase family 9 protein [Kiritimatiellae bacterium]|nr:glycosyltransferase family 9 protein [Kiritimatiellia bacterium]
MRAPRRILFLSLAGAGDTLLATPLIAEVRRHFPAARIEVLTMQGRAPREVLAHNPSLDEVLGFDFAAAGRVGSVIECLRLRTRRYDLSFTVMPQNRLEYNLITWLIGARERVGFEFEEDCGARPRLWLTRVVREDRRLHVVENNLRLLTEGLGLPIHGADPIPRLFVQPEHEARADAVLRELGAAGRTWFGFHPGSGTTKNLILKRWPVRHWAVLARRLVELHPDVRVLLFGSPDERALREEVIRQSGLDASRIALAPDGRVLDTAALIRRMAMFVCGDTLLTHVAAAMQVPTVEIVGPTDPRATGPYRVRSRVVRLGLSCSPCYFFSKHGIRCTHPRPMACLEELEPALVLAAMESLWRETTAAPPGSSAA